MRSVSYESNVYDWFFPELVSYFHLIGYKTAVLISFLLLIKDPVSIETMQHPL
jgi:hypothetical protein